MATSTPNRFPAAAADANRAETTKPTASGKILRPTGLGPLESACYQRRPKPVPGTATLAPSGMTNELAGRP